MEMKAVKCFNAARSIVCVETKELPDGSVVRERFQCRTQHCVCRDHAVRTCGRNVLLVSMPHAALCVSRQTARKSLTSHERCFNAARSIVCVETPLLLAQRFRLQPFQCRTQHCVCRDASTRTFPDGRNGSFNAARSIVCVETLCPAALVPRGLRRHFGKTRFFAPFLASADELCPEKWGSHRRCPLCGAGCTVLERRNGGMRLCARAGALSISFSSYLMIAHASFFFNDVFASMQRGR